MKKFLIYFSILTILIAGCVVGSEMGKFSDTYNYENGLSAYELLNGETAEENTEYSGAADIIVQQNLENTHAVNDVTSIVFDFRGYDTMGEAFILVTAVAGTMVILANHNHKKEEKEDKKDE